MLDNDVKLKPSLSPFHPLPAIGQKLERSTTKVILFDLNQNKRPSTIEDLPSVKSVKIHDYLKPLTALEVHGLTRKSLLENKPQNLLRENTYDVIEPIFLKATKVKKRESLHVEPLDVRVGAGDESTTNEDDYEEEVETPKCRFKKAALQVARLAAPEPGRLLQLRGRLPEPCTGTGRLPRSPPAPPRRLTELSEIFQHLDMRAPPADRMKKENSWF